MSFKDSDRDQELYRSISEAHDYLLRYTDSLTREEYLLDSKTQDAVCMRLQQVLECAGKLSVDVKANLKVNWPSLVAMRNRISHAYIDVDAHVVWDVIKELEDFKALIDWARKNV